MQMLTQKQKIVAVAAVAIIAIIIIFYYINSAKEVYEFEEFEDNADVAENKVEEVEEDTIIIHITGAVESEGIVEVKENARINDVIKAAGGLTEDANLDNVNLAYIVEDGQKIYIPSKLDEDKNIDDGNLVMQGGGENVVDNTSETGKGGLININTANEEKLQELPGIGSQTALKIVTYRTENRQI